MSNSSITLASPEYRRADNVPLSDWDEVVREENRKETTFLGPMLTGLAILVIGVGGFLLWASVTLVAQASMAAGKVIVQSNTKTVTHLEGGTLESLVVAEGDKVNAGSLIATLDVTRSQSNATQLRQQLFVLHIRLARLMAEKDEKTVFDFTQPLPEGMDKDTAQQLVDTERKLFQERLAQFSGQLSVGRSTIEQLKSQRVALVARRQSSAEQVEVVRRDYDMLDKLQERKLATKIELNEKKLQLMDMQTRIAESDASIAEANQRQTQAELSLANTRTDYFRQISEQTQETQADIARIRQEIIAAEDVVAKSAIRSPQTGIIANIRIRTPGSAVLAGQPIVDIVPDNQPMLIEGHAKAADIDSVHVGQKAEIKLTSFGAAETQPLVGHVVYVAADGTTDERTGEVSYVFRATLDEGELKKQPDLFLYPGMTADVYIVNGDRTALAYLTLPILRSFSKAFREQ
ncbi:MAG: HlyD family type I secretion periplasmic adaptor subunit [Nitratireductor sp.]|nr:HlyD family type I secretion periplasmic adaptor subunit [Nitratireductor sp.]